MTGRIAFVGLGIMGRPMAANLVRAGHEVIGFTRSETSRRSAADAGVPVADDLDTAVRGAAVLITMLPDSPDVLAVLLESGSLDALAPESLVIDMSTISPAAAREVHAAARDRGHESLDAPVSGGEAAAIEGTLSIMAGGSDSAFARARPLFDVVGGTAALIGDAGAGQVVKAANQLLVAGHLQMLAEALVFLEAHEVDPQTALGVLAKGLAGSTVIDRKAASMVDGRYAPGFRLELHRKDLGIVRDAAAAPGLSLPLTAAVTQLVNALVARGDGGLDHSALHKLTTELNGMRA